jgi:hypothetical protein
MENLELDFCAGHLKNMVFPINSAISYELYD